MKHPFDFAKCYIQEKLEMKMPSGKSMMTADDTNKYLYDAVLEGRSFAAVRFGAVERNVIKLFEFDVKTKHQAAAQLLCTGPGFFPCDIVSAKKYADYMREILHHADLLGVWPNPFELYFAKKYGAPHLKFPLYTDISPFNHAAAPWSRALKGKKVLVIHPFEDTIKRQYARREQIFPGTDILPAFELKTLKAVQTVAGEKDDRFETWFDALEWMYQEAMKIDFDFAILGCGAYAFPLAIKLKLAGKQAVQLSGETQILFGIKGKRWDSNPVVSGFYNDSWVRPSEAERPKSADHVEGACYW